MLSRWQDDDRCPCSEKQGLALSVQLWNLLVVSNLCSSTGPHRSLFTIHRNIKNLCDLQIFRLIFDFPETDMFYMYQTLPNTERLID